MSDLRWVSCAKDADWATAQKRHFVPPGGLSTMCGSTASHPGTWRGNRQKLKCTTCITVAMDRLLDFPED